MADIDKLNRLGQPIADVYEEISGRVMINLARFFKALKPGETPGGAFEYQAKKLAELGKLTGETRRIIGGMAGVAGTALQVALEKAIEDALEDFGKLRPAAQGILNTAAGEIITGTESFNVAQRVAVERMVDNGLTGYIDHGGHRWRPETYVAMDMRSTMHNASREAFFETNERLDNDLFVVSQHPGARPLCYPWQCKVVAWKGPARDTVDGDGRPVHVYALSDTTYGEPAGLFGINCGHHPMLFIEGVTMVPELQQDEEDNAEAYQISQQHRKLERDFRQARLKIDVARARGDETALDKARDGLTRADGRLDRFCEEHGRKRRREREYGPVKATWPSP